MHLKHFFRGFLKKEEVASAFLATLLENDLAFREAFFKELFPDAALDLAGSRWTVQVETDWVDIRLDSDAAVVLIENKVKAGAYKSGQLLRYYESELVRTPDDKPILVVFVAPEGVGTRETERLAALDTFRENDAAASVSWQKLSAISNSLQQPEARRWFVESGFSEIERIIEQDSRPTYPREGTRAVLADVADEAIRKLRSLSQVQLSRWRGRDFEQICTNKTNVTLWLDLAFDTEGEPPYRPLNVRDGDRLRVFLRTQFKLSGVGQKEPRLRAWWSQKAAVSVFEIPGLGEHHLTQQGWFERSAETVLPPHNLADAMAQAGRAVLGELSRQLDEVGFSLSVSEPKPAD